MDRPEPDWTVERLAQIVGGVVAGDAHTPITGLGDADSAEDGDLVFAESRKYLDLAQKSRAAAIITRPGIAGVASKPLILVNEPRISFLKALEAFAIVRERPTGVHSSAVMAEGVAIGKDSCIGALAAIGAGVKLGDRVEIMSGAQIGAGCVIDDDTTIYPNVVLYPGVAVGKRCIIHAGAVIGSDGFGYVPVAGALRKIPHIGAVRIENDVEIGANCCIDRAKTAETVVGAGTKIDNLVHIAHNVRIGKSCLIVSQVGIAGTTTLGDGVVLAGQVGIVDHLTIGDGVQVGAQSGVRYDITAGERYFGSPAVPLIQRMRDIAITKKLPETLKQIKALEQRIAALEAAHQDIPNRAAEAASEGDIGISRDDIGPVG